MRRYSQSNKERGPAVGGHFGLTFSNRTQSSLVDRLHSLAPERLRILEVSTRMWVASRHSAATTPRNSQFLRAPTAPIEPSKSSATTKAPPAKEAEPAPRSLLDRATGAIESLFATDPGNPVAALPTPTPANGIAIVRHAPSLNGNGRVEGSLRQLTGESVPLNGGAVITNDLQVPGTPTLLLNGNPVFGGTIQGAGSSQPTDYQVTLNGRTTTLGH